jgi:hypothetical protein
MPTTTTSTPHPSAPAPAIRTLEEIAAERATVPDRKAAFERDIVEPARAAVAAEKQTYEAALVTAVRTDGKRPSRDSLDKTEVALRRVEEELKAFDAVVAELEQEPVRAVARKKAAELAANREEIARRQAATPELKAAADAARNALAENENIIQNLMLRNMALQS